MEPDDLSNLDLMPPPIFSRTTLPQLYKYKLPSQRTNSSYKQNSGLILSNGRLSYRHILRNKFITMVEKDSPTIPTAPSPHLDPLSKTIKSMQVCVDRLRLFFAKRPITTRRAVFNSYLDRHGPGSSDSETDNWRPILRFALPYVCYMFKSGPYRDAYVVFGVDPRKEQKWANYQTAIFNFRTGRWRNKAAVQEDPASLWEGRKNHLFTGKDVNSKVVCYQFADITDPMLRKLIDESPLREKFHARLSFWGYADD